MSRSGIGSGGKSCQNSRQIYFTAEVLSSLPGCLVSALGSATLLEADRSLSIARSEAARTLNHTIRNSNGEGTVVQLFLRPIEIITTLRTDSGSWAVQQTLQSCVQVPTAAMLCAAIGMGLHAVLRSIAAFAIFIVAGLDSAAGFVPQYFCPNRNGACASATLFLAAQRWHTWRSLKSRHLQPSSFMSDRRRVPWSGVRTHQAFDGLPLDGSYQGHQPQHSNGMETHSDWGVKMEDDDVDDEGDRAPSAGYAEGIGMGSTEFVNLVKAQFDVLAAMLDVSQIVLLVRRENIETGAWRSSYAIYMCKTRILIFNRYTTN